MRACCWLMLALVSAPSVSLAQLDEVWTKSRLTVPLDEAKVGD